MVHVAAGGDQRLPAAMPEAAAGRTASRPVLRRFSRDRAAVVGVVALALLVLFALAAPLLAALTGH